MLFVFKTDSDQGISVVNETALSEREEERVYPKSEVSEKEGKDGI